MPIPPGSISSIREEEKQREDKREALEPDVYKRILANTDSTEIDIKIDHEALGRAFGGVLSIDCLAWRGENGRTPTISGIGMYLHLDARHVDQPCHQFRQLSCENWVLCGVLRRRARGSALSPPTASGTARRAVHWSPPHPTSSDAAIFRVC